MNKENLSISLTRNELAVLYFSLILPICELKREATKTEIKELDRLKKRLRNHLTMYKSSFQ